MQSYAALAPLAELPQLLLSSSQFEEGLRGVRLSVMASSINDSTEIQMAKEKNLVCLSNSSLC